MYSQLHNIPVFQLAKMSCLNAVKEWMPTNKLKLNDDKKKLLL